MCLIVKFSCDWETLSSVINHFSTDTAGGEDSDDEPSGGKGSVVELG